MDILLLILCVLVILIVLLSNYEINNFIVTKYKINTDKKVQNMRIVVLSDLHNRKYDFENLSIYGAIESMAPNVVLIAGDMITRGDRLECENALPLIRKIASKYKVIYAFGNHEQKMKEIIVPFINELSDLGVVFLSNDKIEFSDVDIYGAEIGTQYYRKFIDLPMNDDYMSGLLGTPEKERFNIMIAHNPAYFKKYSDWGADLVVSGHLHGGVINFPKVRGVVSPQLILFPKYSAGLYKEGAASLIVCRGIGSHSVNLRIFNRPEIVLVEING